MRVTKAQREMVETAIRRHPDENNARIRHLCKRRSGNPITGAAMVAQIRDEMTDAPERTAKPTASSTGGGVAISTSTRVRTSKPAPSCKPRIYKLPENRAFPVAELSEEWGTSEETVKKHARSISCLKYVELEPESFVLCVMHPNTAKKYNGD